jgi:hypothetical protein
MRWTLLCTSTFFLFACVPPAEPESPPEKAEPEPAQDGAIPWAPGEAPSDPSASAREVIELNEPQEPSDDRLEEDGIKQVGASPVCTGKAPPSLRAAVQVRSSDTRACYSSLPSEKAGAKGDLKFTLRVGPSGEVEHLELLSDTLGVSEVTKCAENSLKKSFSETPPRGGCTTFVIPIHFESQTVPAESEAPDGAPEGEASEAP